MSSIPIIPPPPPPPPPPNGVQSQGSYNTSPQQPVGTYVLAYPPPFSPAVPTHAIANPSRTVMYHIIPGIWVTAFTLVGLAFFVKFISRSDDNTRYIPGADTMIRVSDDWDDDDRGASHGVITTLFYIVGGCFVIALALDFTGRSFFAPEFHELITRMEFIAFVVLFGLTLGFPSARFAKYGIMLAIIGSVRYALVLYPRFRHYFAGTEDKIEKETKRESSEFDIAINNGQEVIKEQIDKK